MKNRRVLLVQLGGLLLFCLCRSMLAAENQGEELFETEIRPLLIAKCSECHTGAQKSGGLSLESRDQLLQGGDSGPAINLADPAQSLLLQAVQRTGDLEMPPDEPLSQRELMALKSWLMMKAPWPVTTGKILSPSAQRVQHHWAFQPVTNPIPPPPSSNATIRNPIDQFVSRQLDRAGLLQAKEADKRTLIRRAFYTLTGLPPSSECVARFVADEDPEAYDKLIDELLDSPHYGEHWARHWLDVARYSDTKGYVYAREERFWVHAWTYRDWVVRALNEDLPYDQFLKLQIAADQVEDKRESDLAAMGFLTLGRRFLGVPWEIIDDRIDTLCRATLGLTVGCARCHDHKYDPIPTADYYSLYGVFASSREQLVPIPHAETPPEFEQELTKRRTALRERLQSARRESSQRVRDRIQDYLQAQTELEKYPAQGFDQVFSKEDLLPAFVRRWQYYLHQAERKQDRIFVAWRLYQALPADEFSTRSADVTARLKELDDEQINPLVRARFQTSPVSFTEVIQRYASLFQEFNHRKKSSPAESEGNRSSELSDPDVGELTAVLFGPEAPCEVPDLPVVHTEAFFDSGTIGELWKLQGEVDRWIIQSEQSVPFAVILRDRQATYEPRILRRGDPVNYGEDVPRQFLSLFADGNPDPFKHGSGRRELAERIIDPQNPLTVRVIVNRVWMQHFGQGLVTTPSDFGLRSTSPSHPELLDWLANEFQSHDWSLKHLHKLILTSHTFRQSSRPPEDNTRHRLALQTDPENRLLWKMNPHRLTFEEFRDSLLSVTDDLDPRMGGKPGKIFDAPYLKRRTLYGLIDRQFLPSTLRIFDFANPDLHIPQRSETTVPQQSLFLMNHPLVLERVRSLASLARQHNSNPRQAIEAMFQHALQRAPSANELQEAERFLRLAKTSKQLDVLPTAADWQYGYGAYDAERQRTHGWTLLPHFTGQAWQGGPQWPDATLGWVQLTATGGHPGNTRDHACIRRWIAPRELTIRLQSSLINEPEAGDGVRAFIVSSAGGLLAEAHNHQQVSELNVSQLKVNRGDTIDFIVDIDEVLNSDQFLWEISLEEIDGESTWNSKNDFPQSLVNPLNAWEQLAQALLCTNEFMFVD